MQVPADLEKDMVPPGAWRKLDKHHEAIVRRAARVPPKYMRDLFFEATGGLKDVEEFLSGIEDELLGDPDTTMTDLLKMVFHKSTKFRPGSVGMETSNTLPLVPGPALDVIAAVLQCCLSGKIELSCDPRLAHFDVAWDQRMLTKVSSTNKLMATTIAVPIATVSETKYRKIANGVAHRLLFVRDYCIVPSPPKDRMFWVLFLGKRRLELKDLKGCSDEDRRSLFHILKSMDDWACEEGVTLDMCTCQPPSPCFLVVSLGGELHSFMVDHCRAMLEGSFDVALKVRPNVCDFRDESLSRFGQAGNVNHRLETLVKSRIDPDTRVISLASCGISFVDDGAILMDLCNQARFPNLLALDVSFNVFPSDEKYVGKPNASEWVAQMLSSHPNMQIYLYESEFDPRDEHALSVLDRTQLHRIIVDRPLKINSMLF